MTPERVLQNTPLVLDRAARERYFADGFLTVPGYVGGAWLRRLRAVVDTKIDGAISIIEQSAQNRLPPMTHFSSRASTTMFAELRWQLPGGWKKPRRSWRH